MKPVNNKEQTFVQKLSYELPVERIAKYPLEERDQSKLLIYKNGEMTEDRFYNIPKHLPKNSYLLFNNTRVIHARLKFQRATGAKIEIFCLNPVTPSDYQVNFSSKNTCSWLCMVGNLKKWKDDILEMTVSIEKKDVILQARKVERQADGVVVAFSWEADVSFAEIIEVAGIIPIPPYLNRETENLDNDRYQTVYSRHDGSVAAPTAGLHFTPKILKSAMQQGVQELEVTLHVGAGTFQPVKTDNALEHEMHSEFFTVSKVVIEKLATCIGNVIATGTTTLRTLESLYWLAFLSTQAQKPVQHLLQWEYRNHANTPPAHEVFAQFLKILDREGLDVFSASTGIMIVPGYEFKVVSGLITNYHQPESTLLLLVAAFIGDDWKQVYDFALQNNFRFLSYGDSSLLWKK